VRAKLAGDKCAHVANRENFTHLLPERISFDKIIISNPKIYFMSTDTLSDFYDNYDYTAFWNGRNYENGADEIAVSRLLSIIIKDKSVAQLNFIDMGCGPGRMVHIYEPIYKEITLLDSSVDQLKEAQGNVKDVDKSKTVLANVQETTLQNEHYDVALCLRVFHYISNPEEVFKEMNRILKPGGYLILEIPNKLNFKNRIRSIFVKKHENADSGNQIIKSGREDDLIFVNHNPKDISALLKSSNFEVIELLSVSNFRSTFIKKIFPIPFLLFIEKFTQKVLAFFWFGPSIYFLARKVS